MKDFLAVAFGILFIFSLFGFFAYWQDHRDRKCVNDGKQVIDNPEGVFNGCKK